MELHGNLEMYFTLYFITHFMQWKFTQWYSFKSYRIDEFVEKKLIYVGMKRFYCFFKVYMKVTFVNISNLDENRQKRNPVYIHFELHPVALTNWKRMRILTEFSRLLIS